MNSRRRSPPSWALSGLVVTAGWYFALVSGDGHLGLVAVPFLLAVGLAPVAALCGRAGELLAGEALGHGLGWWLFFRATAHDDGLGIALGSMLLFACAALNVAGALTAAGLGALVSRVERAGGVPCR
ncbi:MAG: hypothetical protein IAE78_03175 [Myxococcus sp.]|nr:hypothetical protein [Myxococcus sp.]